MFSGHYDTLLFHSGKLSKGDFMREEYIIGDLHPRRNPYFERLKAQDFTDIKSSTSEHPDTMEEVPTNPNTVEETPS